MIERTEQLRQVEQRIEESISGGARRNVLFVTGEAGIGKSTLLRMIEERCRTMTSPPLVARAECSTPLAGQEIGEVEALEPWAVILRQLAEVSSGAAYTAGKMVAELATAWVRCVPVVGSVIESAIDTARIVKKAVDDNTPPKSAATQAQVFQQYINVLRGLSGRTPLLLMLDDMHWADASSTNLLFTAARELRGLPVLFIVAYRPDDASSSLAGEGHGILHLRNELERYDMADEVGVPRMTSADLQSLLHERYPGYSENARFEQWLTTVSAGNALFITQFLQTLEEDGVIDVGQGGIVGDFERVVVPRSVQAVVGERIRRMDESSRELLRYASVEGDTFTPLVLSAVTEMPMLKLLQKLRLIEQTHHVIHSLGRQTVYAQETTAYQFAHLLLQRAMYESLGEEERELLHQSVLAVLQQQWEQAKGTEINLSGLAARIAVHAEVVGDHRHAARILLEGAQWSWDHYAAHETLQSLEGVFRNLRSITAGRDPEVNSIEVAARILRGNVNIAGEAAGRSLEDFIAARALVDRETQPERWVDLLNREAQALFRLNRVEESEQVARTALAEATAVEYLQGTYEALNAVGAVMSVRASLDELLSIRLQAVEIASKLEGATILQVQSLTNLGVVHSALGETSAAVSCYEQSLEIARASNDYRGQVVLLINLASIAYRRGEKERAVQQLHQCIEICHRIGDVRSEAAARTNLGIIASEAGRTDEALVLFEGALAIVRRINDIRREAALLCVMGETYGTIGDYPRAEEHIRRGLAIYEEQHDRVDTAWAWSLLGSVDLQRSALGSARTHFERAYGMAVDVGEAETEGVAIGSLGRVAAREAESLSEPERTAKLQEAMEQIEQCIRIMQKIGRPVKRWQEELAALEHTPP